MDVYHLLRNFHIKQGNSKVSKGFLGHLVCSLTRMWNSLLKYHKKIYIVEM